MEYRQIVERSIVRHDARGIDRRDMPDAIREHQRHAVDFALEKGNSALFLDTGLGKSLCAFAYSENVASETGKPVLMLAPLGVTGQHLTEAKKFGFDDAVIVRGGEDVKPGLNLCNYERLHLFDPGAFGGLILDECFAPDTQIDVVDEQGIHSKKHIEKIEIGDRIVNASGIDRVSDIHRREVPYAVRIRFNGQSVIASPNHPFFTQRGWVGSRDIEPGDILVSADKAMRMVRGQFPNKQPSRDEEALLQQILLSEMAYASTGNISENPLPRGSEEACGKQESMAPQRRSKGNRGNRQNYRAQSHVEAGSTRKSLPPVESHEARTFRAWGKWEGYDRAAIVAQGCTVRQLGGGICFVTGGAQSRISNALQNRLSQHRAQNCYRGGWSLTSITRLAGPQERRHAFGYGVDGIEILELGHPDLDKYRNDDGKLYFYDLGGTRHPSFSIHGALVHNSSVIKNFSGITTRRLMEFGSHIPFRLACTATPAPNDHMELGQHCQFLGVMSSSEMLSRWFIADQSEMGRYRLKRHAVNSYWNWVASWARCAEKPSDLGGDDTGYDLPPLNLQRHIVKVDIVTDAGDDEGQGRLFRIPSASATSIHREKRKTADDRAAKIAELVRAEPDEAWIIWVDTDYDADALKSLLPEATEVHGRMTPEQKEAGLADFSEGRSKWLVTKGSIAGFGLNWQHCARVAFVGLSYSYEAFYQSVRRCWRYGQTRPVNVHVASAETEEAIWQAIVRKRDDHDTMKVAMRSAMARAQEVRSVKLDYEPEKKATPPPWMETAQ